MSTALIIDDEPQILDLYKIAFEAKGFTVLIAHSGEEGLDKAKQLPSIIFLDIMLPTIDGLETLKALKNDPSTKNIPVIMLTNLEIDREKEAAVGLGAVDYIVKSNYTPQEIVARVIPHLPA